MRSKLPEATPVAGQRRISGDTRSSQSGQGTPAQVRAKGATASVSEDESSSSSYSTLTPAR